MNPQHFEQSSGTFNLAGGAREPTLMAMTNHDLSFPRKIQSDIVQALEDMRDSEPLSCMELRGTSRDFVFASCFGPVHIIPGGTQVGAKNAARMDSDP